MSSPHLSLKKTRRATVSQANIDPPTLYTRFRTGQFVPSFKKHDRTPTQSLLSSVKKRSLNSTCLDLGRRMSRIPKDMTSRRQQSLRKMVSSQELNIHSYFRPSQKHLELIQHIEQCEEIQFVPTSTRSKPNIVIECRQIESASTLCDTPKMFNLRPRTKLEDFTKLKLLGQGKFGGVYLVRHKETGFMAALKTMKKRLFKDGSVEDNEKTIRQMIQQIKIQSFLQHPNLIKLYDFFDDQDHIYLLLEVAIDGHLFDLLQRVEHFSQETTSLVMRQVVSGVHYMHEKAIIHRDLKLENIVLSCGMAKICDFGWSIYCPRDIRSTLCGTPIYLSPQILMGQQYNKKIDVWALGALAHQMFTAQNPFKIRKPSQLNKIIKEQFEMTSGSPQLRSFITFILRKNPNRRPDLSTLKRHPFLEKYQLIQTSQELCVQPYSLQ